MTVIAFCPGHVSCVFQPVESQDIIRTGSRGIGIRLNVGAHAHVTPRDDGVVAVRMDGEAADAPVTRMAAGILAPGEGFDIAVENDLPVSQGFGMSAAGALAASLCIADIVGLPRETAFVAVHEAEVRAGGGLGDVSAIVSGAGVPIRTVAGLPPAGEVTDAGFRIPELTLAVIGGDMRTGAVLGDPDAMRMIEDAASGAIDLFLDDPTEDRLYEVSNAFSANARLESPGVRDAMDRMSAGGHRVGMCMLGNSIFTDATPDAVRELLGDAHARVFPCASSSLGIPLTRRV